MIPTTLAPAPVAVVTKPDPTGLPASARVLPSEDLVDWAPLANGPYDVGAITVTLQDEARPLTVEIWFPLDPTIDVRTLTSRRYSLMTDVYYDSPRAYDAFADFIVPDSSFPLVVYSHGSGGLRYIDSAYTETLASHGFVVAATDHTGNTAIDLLADTSESIAKIMIDRPTDVRRVIDALTGKTSIPDLAPVVKNVDPDRIAVTGHSVGGATAISTVTGYSDALGSVSPDPRVKAIIPIAPTVAGVFSSEQLASIDIPMMVIAASEDATTPVDPNVTTLWNETLSGPTYVVELVGAEHNSFTDMCAYQAAFGDRAEVPDRVKSTVDDYARQGCAIGTMSADHAHELTTTYAVRFLSQVLSNGVPVEIQSPPNDVVLTRRS